MVMGIASLNPSYEKHLDADSCSYEEHPVGGAAPGATGERPREG